MGKQETDFSNMPGNEVARILRPNGTGLVAVDKNGRVMPASGSRGKETTFNVLKEKVDVNKV